MLFFAAVLLWQQQMKPQKTMSPQQTSKELVFKTANPQSNAPPVAPQNVLNVIRASDFSDAEKADLKKKFDERIKPTVDRWLLVYDGHCPFKSDDFTFDKFHNRLGRNSSFYVYTFVFDGLTVAVQESNGKYKMNYLMQREGAVAINSIPPNGFVPDLNVPVSKEEIIRMVEADTNIRFKPNEIIIRPTGAATALKGGAFVDVLPEGKDPNNALNFKIAMVFGADKNLVNYERDPFF